MFGYKSYTVFGWVIAVVLAVLGLRWGAEIVFHTETPARLGLAIELPDESASAADEAPAEPDLGTLLAAADPANGAQVAKVCSACHNFENGGPNGIGPNLWGVPGRPIAQHAGFSYSAAFTDFGSGRAWGWEDLNTFLQGPSKAVPGTAMSFNGIRKATDRADLLAYLNSISSAPLPFPAPAAPVEPAVGASDSTVPAEGVEPGTADGPAPETLPAPETDPVPAAPGATPPPQ